MYVCMLGYTQIESLDRGARFITTPMPGQAAVWEERGHRRSRKSCLGPRAGSSENIRRTVTFFVERYQESMGTLFPFSGTALAKRFFFHSTRRRGKLSEGKAIL